MNPILKKLGLTNQNPIVVLNAPEEYKTVLAETESEVEIGINGQYKFIQIFAKDLAEANKYAEKAVKALDGDGHLWLCYPKGTSKKYKTDLNRTKSWEVFSPFEFEPVSQVAIDDDWSAMRFRHIDNIKTLTRKTAATEKGKERIKENDTQDIR